MPLLGGSLTGFVISASDGELGTFRDILFEDTSWRCRWLVVRTGAWLRGRTVLLHPSSFGYVDHDERRVHVSLTRRELNDSPDILLDEPVSRQIEYGLHCFANWDPEWGNPRFVAGVWGGVGVRVAKSRLAEETRMHKTPRSKDGDQGDPHLRSVDVVLRGRVSATDGPAGHLEDFVIDEKSWLIRYLVLDTRHWWPGKCVLLSPSLVDEISWSHLEVRLNVDCSSVRAEPAWDRSLATLP